MRRARARADADLQRALDATRVWVNASAEYDFVRGTGTYFASAISHFLATIFVPQLGGTVADAFVVFPDHGAHVRFYSMVHSRVSGLPLERICYISKSRVGEDITQSETLQYIDSDGLTHLGQSDTLGHTHLAGRQLERRPSKVDDAKALIVQKVGDRYKTLHEAFRKVRAQSGAIRAQFVRNSWRNSWRNPRNSLRLHALGPARWTSTRTRS